MTVNTPGRDLIEITKEIQRVVTKSGINGGLVHLFIQHTSASLTIQENADPDVCADLIAYFDRIAPESDIYNHAAEGRDDMPAHIKSALTTTSLLIPLISGQLGLGTWQGIYLFEHRHAPQNRRVVLTFLDEAASY